MKNGNWIPIDKQVKFWFPRDRAYTEIEALICHTIDLQDGRAFTINGYAKLWCWSRNKVRRFLENINKSEGYHKDKHRILKGHLEDIKRTSTGHGVTIKINNLEDGKDTKRTLKGHSEVHYYNNNIKNKEYIKNDVHFLSFWKAYPRKVGKGAAEKAWLSIAPANGTIEAIMSALERQKPQWKDKKFIPHPSTWLNQRRWEDEADNEDWRD